MDNNGLFNVKNFGAIGDGEWDDTNAFRAAITKANSLSGGVVWVPAGKYKITGRLEISRQVILQGVGWNPAVDTEGSWLFMTDEKAPDMPFIEITESNSSSGRGTIIRDLAIHHLQPNASTPNWAPKDYPFAIQINGGSGDDVFIDNIMLRDATCGIRISTGRVNLRRIFGIPLTTGIEIDNALDVVKIDNVHFWNGFWSDEPVWQWLYDNGTAIKSLKNDNPHFSNIFILGYKYGFHFGSSSNGITNKYHIVNVDCDYCAVGIFIDASNTTGQLCNYTFQGAGPNESRLGEYGIYVKGVDGVMIQGVNTRIVRTKYNAVRIENDSKAYLENISVLDWDLGNQGYPAYEAQHSNSKIILGAGRDDPGGNLYSTTGIIKGATLENL